MQRYSKWINLKDEEKSEEVGETPRSAVKAITALFGMAMALLDNRRHAILRKILTGTSVGKCYSNLYDACSERYGRDDLDVDLATFLRRRGDLRHRRGHWCGTWYPSHASRIRDEEARVKERDEG